MKQLDLFNNDQQSPTTKKPSVWALFVDGASRNNPGPSGAGIYIEKDNILEIKEGYYLGIKTNNQAEYLALVLGLFIVACIPEHENRLCLIPFLAGIRVYSYNKAVEGLI